MHYEGTERTAPNVLRDQVNRLPDQPLLRSGAGTYTRRDVDRTTNWLAQGLMEIGVRAGDNVLLLLDNTERYVFSWLALAKLGAIEVPVNPAYRGQMLAHIVNSSGASLMIADRAHLQSIERVGSELESLRTVLVADVEGDPATLTGLSTLALGSLDVSDSQPGAADPSYRDVMALMYTSGTTGPAKGVLITNAHAYEYANSVRETLELNESDIYYAPLPLFHIAGQWAVVYAALMSGGVAVIKERFSVSNYWADVAQSRASVSFLLGAMANFLHGQPPSPTDADNTLTRLLMSPLVPELAGFRERFGVQVATAYGSTECNVPILSDFSIDDPRQCGRARAGWEVAILDQDDEPMPVGEAGEIAVRPPEPWLTMRGYLGNPAASAEAYRNCWLHTGDIAFADADGNFIFVDRKHDVIRRRGENISSFEAEREVNAHPSVLESAAIGVPSEHTEEEVLACVVLGDEQQLEPDELHRFLTENAPKFMVPRYIRIVDELPKTPTGKVQKALMREQGTSDSWDALRQPSEAGV